MLDVVSNVLTYVCHAYVLFSSVYFLAVLMSQTLICFAFIVCFFIRFFFRASVAPNTHVHCHLPNWAMGLRTIAINRPQYDNSRACGMCIEVDAPGNRCEDHRDDPENKCGLGGRPIKGKFIAIITDELFERGEGDLDIGEVGDGHWPVFWKPVPCPIPSWRSPAIVLHEGANRNYMKVQFRYNDSPMEKVIMDGEESFERTHDNYYVFYRPGDGYDAGSDGTFNLEMWTVLGRKYCGKIDTEFKAQPYEYHAWDCTPESSS